jgi:hypothetical protein
MDFDRSSALIGILLLVGVILIAIPVLVPPDVPDNRVEFYVEADWMDQADQTNLAYANLSQAARETFDEARRATPETINRSASAAPESLTPPPDSIDLFNVRYEDEFYLLQVRYLTYETDFVTQQLPRLGLLAAGIVCLVGAAYWRFEG